MERTPGAEFGTTPIRSQPTELVIGNPGLAPRAREAMRADGAPGYGGNLAGRIESASLIFADLREVLDTGERALDAA